MTDQPDGIADDSHDYPKVHRAAERVLTFISEFGDGLVMGGDDDGLPPLYARDLAALAKAAQKPVHGPRGPVRAKRLYRVVLMGMAYSVRHYQDKRAAFERAQSVASKSGLSAEIYESPIIVWPERPIARFASTTGSDQKKPRDESGIARLRRGECMNCGHKGAHYVPPSFGDAGFFACDSFCETCRASSQPTEQATRSSGRWESK